MVDQYVERPVGTLPGHKFANHMTQGKDFESMPAESKDKRLKYLLEVFVDDYISLAIFTSQE